jgi:hypothetical protein
MFKTLSNIFQDHFKHRSKPSKLFSQQVQKPFNNISVIIQKIQKHFKTLQKSMVAWYKELW